MDRPEEDTEEVIDREALMRWADEAPEQKPAEEEDLIVYDQFSHRRRLRKKRMCLRKQAKRR